MFERLARLAQTFMLKVHNGKHTRAGDTEGRNNRSNSEQEMPFTW